MTYPFGGAGQIWRDGTGPHRPIKSQIREWGAAMEAAVLGIKASRVFYASAYGVVADGVTDDSAAAQSVIDAASCDENAGEKGCVIWPGGDIYFASPVHLRRRTTHIGSGRTNGVYAHDENHAGTRFVVDGSDLFDNANLSPAGKVQGVTFIDCSFWSNTGGGILFNMDAETTGFVENVNFVRCSLGQFNAGKQIWKAPVEGDCFSIHWEDFNLYWPDATTVNMIDGLSKTTNNYTFKRFTATKKDKTSNAGMPCIRLDRTGGGQVSNCSIEDGILQQCVAGFLDLGAPEGFVGKNLRGYDAVVDASNPVFHFRTSAGGAQPDTMTLIACNSDDGVSSAPDVKVTTTQSQSGLTLVDSKFSVIDLGGSSRRAVAVGATPVSAAGLVSGGITQHRGGETRFISPSGIGALGFDGARLSLANDSRIRKGKIEVALTADQHNLDIGNAARVVITSASDGAYDLTGIVAGQDGDEVRIENISGHTQTFRHNHTGSDTANQLTARAKTSYDIVNNTTLDIQYSSAAGKWIQIT